MECKHVGNRVIQKKGEASTCKSLLQCKWLHSYLSSLITSTKWASVFSRMFLNLSGRRADWSKLTPAHLPFSCKISHREVWLLVSFSSWGGLRSPFCVLELGPPEACRKTRGSRHRGWSVRMQQCYSAQPVCHWSPAGLCTAHFHLHLQIPVLMRTFNLSAQLHLHSPRSSDRISRHSGNQESDIVGGVSEEGERRPREELRILEFADHRTSIPEGRGEGLGASKEVQGGDPGKGNPEPYGLRETWTDPASHKSGQMTHGWRMRFIGLPERLSGWSLLCFPPQCRLSLWVSLLQHLPCCCPYP